MADLNKKTASTILAATLASGVAAGRLTAPVIDSSAKPIGMRWLNEGVGKPDRYAIAIEMKVGKGAGGREIVCSADGIPRLDGMPEDTVFDDSDARAICVDTVKYGVNVKKHVDAIATKIVK